MKSPAEIIQIMLDNDAYSNWLGVNVELIEPGRCTLSCTVHESMLNGFGIAHGGITYALSDSALAFAANSHGQQCVSIETSISHIKPVLSGDKLNVRCEEIQRGKTIGRYTVEIYNQHDQLVSLFNGTVFRNEKTW